MIYLEIYNKIKKRRSIRRFKQKEIELSILKKFVNAARLAPSAANLQPLEFFIVNDVELKKKLFTTLSWAGYLKPEWKPAENERPAAYIIILADKSISNWYQRDASFAAENIILCAEEKGIGSCVICKVDKESLGKIIHLPYNLIIDSVIALGYKNEQPVVEEYKDSIKYWKDEDDVLHVPKKKLENIIHINNF